MKKEINKSMSVVAVLLIISVILNIVFLFFIKRGEWSNSSEDETQLETVINQQKVEIEALKLKLEQAEEPDSEGYDGTETSPETDLGEPPVTADNKDNNGSNPDTENDSTADALTGCTAAAESFMDALLTYSSDDMDSRNERLKAVISGSDITAKLITSGVTSETETGGVSGNTSWQTEYSSKLEESQIYIHYTDQGTTVKALADVSYTLTDEFGTMTMSAFISIEMKQDGQGDYKVTKYEIMSKS